MFPPRPSPCVGTYTPLCENVTSLYSDLKLPFLLILFSLSIYIFYVIEHYYYARSWLFDNLSHRYIILFRAFIYLFILGHLTYFPTFTITNKWQCISLIASSK